MHGFIFDKQAADFIAAEDSETKQVKFSTEITMPKSLRLKQEWTRAKAAAETQSTQKQ